jgi:anti-sigma28 factor (negative regulator of flagellin synthesis)
VAQIQKQIDNGTYKIDGGKIAERMLREMQLNSGLWLR